MSYRIYHTEGFIIASRDINEDSRLLRILTPDLGLVTVMGQGTRKNLSKLRPHLQDAAHLQLSLVRGREFWRLIAAERSQLTTAVLRQPVWSRLCVLLKRLVRGEGEQQILFSDIKAAVQFLATLTTPEAIGDFELILTLRILRQLGYLPNNRMVSNLIDFTDWSPSLVVPLSLKPTIRQEVINSLAASHL